MKAQTIVARNIRRLRVARSLSQEILALDASVDRTYVGRLERGMENPTIAILERLATALDVDIAEFLDREPVARGPVKPLPGGRRKQGLRK